MNLPQPADSMLELADRSASALAAVLLAALLVWAVLLAGVLGALVSG